MHLEESLEESALETSRLDVISCGLGGAVLLAIIFSVIKEIPPAKVGAPPYIAFAFEHGEKGAIVDLILGFPDGTRRQFDLKRDFLADGSLTNELNAHFAPLGVIHLTRDISIIPNSRRPFRNTLWISNPKLGEWSFAIRYVGHEPNEALQVIAGGTIPVVDIRLYVESNEKANDVEERDVPKYGNQTDPISISIR